MELSARPVVMIVAGELPDGKPPPAQDATPPNKVELEQKTEEADEDLLAMAELHQQTEAEGEHLPAKVNHITTEVNAGTKELHGVVLSQDATESSLKDALGPCLKERCPCPHDVIKTNLLGVFGHNGLDAPTRPQRQGETLSPNFMAGILYRVFGCDGPGPLDPVDGSIPWSINIHLVATNVFAMGKRNLGQRRM